MVSMVNLKQGLLLEDIPAGSAAGTAKMNGGPRGCDQLTANWRVSPGQCSWDAQLVAGKAPVAGGTTNYCSC